MSNTAQLKEPGEFLKARRAELIPGAVGLLASKASGPGNRVTSCDLGVFTDQPAEPVAP